MTQHRFRRVVFSSRSTSQRTQIYLCLAGFIMVNLTGCGQASSVKEPAGQSAQRNEDVILPVPELPATEWLNASVDVQYIGSNQCKKCHQDVHQSFQMTRHSRAFSDTSGGQDPSATVRNELSGHEYTTRTTDEGKLIHTESILLKDGTAREVREVEIDYTVGSGRFGKSYLTKLDGFLVQSPLTWFQDRQEWGLSPGYDHQVQYSFRRTVSAKCLYCHTGTVDVVDQNEYFPKIHEQFVSCERCHGPGELHERKHQGTRSPDRLLETDVELKTDDVDRTIVNPSHLDRELQEAICQQCHLQTDAQIAVRGYKFDSFRPGLPLTAVRQDYHFGPLSSDMTVVGHVDQLHQSRCYTESETLTCATCHQPHSGDPLAESTANHRKSCLQCHDVEACGEPMAERTKHQDHCTVCHMPSAATEIPHVAFTHHRIAVHPSSQNPTQNQPAKLNDDPEYRELVEAVLGDDHLGKADRLRCRGLAALGTYLKKQEASNRVTLRYAQESLQEAWDLGARDASVAAAMAKIAFEVDWPEKSEYWSKIALELDASPSEDRNSALMLLSELQFERKQFQEAYIGFVELTKIRRDARMWFFRGACAQNLGKTEEALSSLKKSIEINPQNQAAHVALAALYQSLKDEEQAAVHRKWASDLLR